MSETENKREVLRDKVVDLVKEFVETEGGMESKDLHALFGPPSFYTEVATALADLKINFR